MLARKPSFCVPCLAEANCQGELTPQQRKKFLYDLILLGAGVLILVAGAIIVFATGKQALLGFLFLFGAGLVGLAMQEPWQIYREPKPQIVSYAGRLQPIPNTNVRRGGFVAVGEKRVYLSRLQLLEVHFGRHYEIFLITPQKTAVSARMIEV